MVIENYNNSFLSHFYLTEENCAILKSFINEEIDLFPSTIFAEAFNTFKSKHRAMILHLNPKGIDCLSFYEIHKLNPFIASLLGKPLVQNEQGDTVISVYDRDRFGAMAKGSRYHQTREGGSIHTDNVNIPEIWDYLYLSCISSALVGGENILVDGVAVHRRLKEKFPEALTILEDDFIWEMRGVSESLYRAPIITYDEEGEPLFRHLRPYMESAHFKADEPLTPEQLYAVDVLDAVTNSSEFQVRYRMEKGDALITKDAQLLHGRTCFSDDLDAINFDEYQLNPTKKIKRTMERLWIQK